MGGLVCACALSVITTALEALRCARSTSHRHSFVAWYTPGAQHENNAITLLYTNCLWLKHHDDPISILHFEYCLHIPSILFCIQILVIFWDTEFRQFSHESMQKNDPKFAHRIKYFELPNSLQIRDPEWDHHDVSTINN